MDILKDKLVFPSGEIPSAKSLNRTLRLLVLSFSAISLISAAKGFSAVAVSNLGDTTTNSAGVVGAADGPGQKVAGEFTTGSAASLADVTLSLTGNAASNAGFSVALYSNAGSAPGTALATLTGNSSPGTGNYVYSAATPFALSSGTSYWIVASQSGLSGTAWNQTSDSSSTGKPGWSIGATEYQFIFGGSGAAWSTGIFNPNGPPFESPGTGNVQFSVDVVPEPASFAIAAVAGIGLLARRRK